MCITYIDNHLCGYRGGTLRTERCQNLVAIEYLDVSAPNYQNRLAFLNQRCVDQSVQRDKVDIDFDCSDCVGYYEQLGELAALLHCINMERASRM
jgi:hypothetical protein